MKSSQQLRVELLAALAQLANLRPQWRLGQTMANIAMTAGRIDSAGVWDIEDDEALAAAHTLIRQCSESELDAADQNGSRAAVDPTAVHAS